MMTSSIFSNGMHVHCLMSSSCFLVSFQIVSHSLNFFPPCSPLRAHRKLYNNYVYVLVYCDYTFLYTVTIRK